MEKLAVLGGTFNPIHNGHLHLARCCAAALGLGSVLLIPTFLPPHKQARDLASGENRLAMCRIVAADDPLFAVSDVELRRGGSSYTVETLRQLEGEYPQTEFTLLLGADMLLTFDQWYRYEEIMQRAVLCAGARDQKQLPALYAKKMQLQALGGRCEIVPFDAMPLSSTQLRERISSGEDVADLVPKGVWEYIQAKGLYRREGEHSVADR